MTNHQPSSLTRSYYFAWISLGALASALVGLVAYPWLPFLTGSLLIALISASACVWMQLRLRHEIQVASNALGGFIRGNLDARLTPAEGHDMWVNLQHRINNVMDITDVAARQQHAAIDASTNDAYATKIRNSGLAVKLMQNRAPAAPVLEIPAQLNIDPMLQRIEALQQSLYKLQHSTRDMLLRAATNQVTIVDDAMQRTIQHAVDYTRNSPTIVKQLHQTSEQLNQASLAIDQLAERGEVAALNLAISAAHAGGDERLNNAASAIRLLTEQLRDTGTHVARLIEASQAATSGAMRAIYDMASLVHHIQQAQEHTGQSYQASERVTALAEARKALTAADALNDEANALGAQLRDVAEAA